MTHARDGERLVLLDQLARACGIQPAYYDLQGAEIHAPTETLVAALRAMGAIDSEADLADALAIRRRDEWLWAIPAVIVVWDDDLPGAELHVPDTALGVTARCTITLDGGGQREWTWRLDGSAVLANDLVDGQTCVALRIEAPEVLPVGYHKLTVELAGHRLEALVVAAPSRAYQAPEQRTWGVFLPLHALHSHRSWGIGDYTDLYSLLRWSASQGASFVATLPLLPSFLGEPYDPSPYQPVSRLFWNEVYVDPEAPVEGVRRIEEKFAASARSLTASREIDYRAVMDIKRRAMSAQAETAMLDDGVRAHIAQSIAENPRVQDYARFRAACERLGPDWRRWPDGPARGFLGFDDFDEEVERYYVFAQWRASEQMRAAAATAAELGQRLYLDLPVGVHNAGYDAWRFQDLFAQGMSVGAPPDLLATNGQNWGFRPLLPDVVRRSGYEYVRAYLHHFLSLAKMLRIDHAIGLHRLYWIPEGAAGKDGVFVRQPAEELYAILSIESHRHEAVLVGENLGLVPPEVNAGLEKHGLQTMYVQMFEMTGDARCPLNRPAKASAASFSSHDLPPFAAYWVDDDLKQRRALRLLTPERAREEMANRTRDRAALTTHLQRRGLVEAASTADIYRANMALLAESPAGRVVVNLEDCWGEIRAQNLPGTDLPQHANWVGRAAYALDDFDSVAGLTEALSLVAKHRLAGHAAAARSSEERG